MPKGNRSATAASWRGSRGGHVNPSSCEDPAGRSHSRHGNSRKELPAAPTVTVASASTSPMPFSSGTSSEVILSPSQRVLKKAETLMDTLMAPRPRPEPRVTKFGKQPLGGTPQDHELWLAARKANEDQVRSLLEARASAQYAMSPVDQDSDYYVVFKTRMLVQCQAIHMAAYYQCFQGAEVEAARKAGEAVKLLLPAKATASAEEARKAAEVEAARKAGEVVKLLLAAKATASAEALCETKKKGEGIVETRKLQPIHLAASAGNIEVIELLLKNNVDVDTPALIGRHASGPIKFDNHYMPIHDAVWFKHTDTVRFLLQRGADISATNLEGNTALHLAAKLGHEEIVELLLSTGKESGHGKDFLTPEQQNKQKKLLEMENKNGKVALEVAVENGRFDLRKLYVFTQAYEDTSLLNIFVKVARACPEAASALLSRKQDDDDDEAEGIIDGTYRAATIEKRYRVCMQAAAQEEAPTNENQPFDVVFLANLVRHAPQAAVDVLDALTDKPEVVNQEHHPLPIRAHLPLGGDFCPLSCVYEDDVKWHWDPEGTKKNEGGKGWHEEDHWPDGSAIVSTILGITSFLHWTNVLYELRAFQWTGQRLLPIMNSVPQIGGMLVIILFLLVGFLHAFWAMERSAADEIASDEIKSWQILTFLFIGDNFIDDDELGNDGFGKRTALVVLGGFGVFTFTVCAMNLFIAVLGDVYDQQQEQTICTFLKERARICCCLFMRPELASVPKLPPFKSLEALKFFLTGLASFTFVFWCCAVLEVSSWPAAMALAGWGLLLQLKMRKDLTLGWERKHLWLCTTKTTAEEMFSLAQEHQERMKTQGRVSKLKRYIRDTVRAEANRLQVALGKELRSQMKQREENSIEGQALKRLEQKIDELAAAAKSPRHKKNGRSSRGCGSVRGARDSQFELRVSGLHNVDVGEEDFSGIARPVRGHDTGFSRCAFLTCG